MDERFDKREHWGSKLGIILAVSGSAVGLGNFLKFPGVAAANGGGAFLIPYFIALICIGVPLMWIEWTLGRLGGAMGHGTSPGIFQSLSPKNKWIKYVGLIGLFGPLVIFIYYTYIESWLLGYVWFSLTGKYAAAAANHQMGEFLSGYQGLTQNQYFDGLKMAYFFFLITFLLNFAIVYRGITRGIEWVSKTIIPLLIVLAIIILLRVLTLHTDGMVASIYQGFGFLWNADFSQLKNAKVWLAAAGQVFFTLSVGIGVILTYASYLKKNQDVTLSGLTSVSTNEFCEIVLAGSIVIPAAFAFFGPIGTRAIAEGGIFDLGFITMPMIFNQIPLGQWISVLWFGLLFLAGITSSISLIQPVIAFLEDEFKIKRHQAVTFIGILVFLLCQPAIFWLGHGVVGELDFWGGNMALILFGLVEVILFSWVFGIEKAWKAMHVGAQLKVPVIFKWIMKYITPAFLIIVLIAWLWQDGMSQLTLANFSDVDRPYIWYTRFFLIAITLMLGLLIKIASRRWHFKK